jgi:hypothetical protein
MCFFESELKSICIPRSVSIIAEKSFLWCQLTNLEFENRSLLTEIGTRCFSGSPLKSICIPGLISKLYKSVFFGWLELERITFEAGSKLRHIEDFCFSETSLKHICLPNELEFLNGTVFSGCPIESITFQSTNRRFYASDEFLVDLIQFRLVRYFGKSTEVALARSIRILDSLCFANSKLERLSFESDSKLVRIDDRCFYRCPMKVIWIPRHVDFIAGSAFQESAIESIFFEPVNQRFVFQEGFLIDRIESRIVRCLNRSDQIHIPQNMEILEKSSFSGLEIKEVTFEQDLKLIGEFCFSLSHLQSICIPSSVEILCKSCFEDCKNISIIKFESNSHLTQIDESCFARSALESICIPSSVLILGISCFFECSDLVEVTFESESRLTRIESSCFYRSALKQIHIPQSVEILCESCFAGSFKLKTIKFESDSHLTEIRKSCFAGCQLESICIPRSVLILPERCFDSGFVGNLTFESDSKLRRIERLCFERCSFLSICIPGSVEFIGGGSFMSLGEGRRFIIEEGSKLHVLEDWTSYDYERGDLIELRTTTDEDVSNVIRLKEMHESLKSQPRVAFRLDLLSGSKRIPNELKGFYPDKLWLYSSSDSLELGPEIGLEFISEIDFCCCQALRHVSLKRFKSVHGFKRCRLLESIEISWQ